jgi:sugar/nucleoside kinase (ribokinase family)
MGPGEDPQAMTNREGCDVLVLNTSVVDLRRPDFNFVARFSGPGGVTRAPTRKMPPFSPEQIRAWLREGCGLAGGPGNCAPLMARAGLKVAVGANLGRGRDLTADGRLRLDPQGKFFYDALVAEGILVTPIVLTAELPTGMAFIHDAGPSERGAVVYFPGANDAFAFEPARAAVRRLSPRVVYYMYSGLSVGGDARGGRDLAEFMGWCGEQGIVTIADSHTLTGDPAGLIAAGDPVPGYRLLAPLLPRLDIFFTSGDEARLIANTLPYLRGGAFPAGHEGRRRFLRALLEANPGDGARPRLLGLTVRDGAYYIVSRPGRGPGGVGRVKSRFGAGRCVDLVGAGDAFRAGVLTYLVHHLDQYRAGDLDFRAAAQTGNLMAALYIKAPLGARYEGVRGWAGLERVVDGGRSYASWAGVVRAVRRASAG